MENISNEWNALTPEEQRTEIKKAVYRLAKLYYGGTWVLTRHGMEVEDYINAGFVEVLTDLGTDREARSLKHMIYRATNRYMSSALRWARIDAEKNGGELDATRVSIEDLTETITLRVDLERFISSRDAIDQKIIEMVGQGYTERQIATKILISNVAVHKRIVKIRAALIEAIA